jgi:hypothetical protein
MPFNCWSCYVADEVDHQLERAEPLEAANLAQVRRRANQIPPGKPGDCDLCGEWSARLVGGVCAPCRDRYRLP